METTITATGDIIAKRIGFTPTLPELGNWPTSGEKFIIGDELREYGKFLINKYRNDLKGTNIEYIFKPKASKNGETAITGSAKVENDLQKTLHGYDAIIMIGWDEWCALDIDNKLRIIYTELEKLFWDEKSSKLKTRQPEVASFPSVMQIFGPSSNAEIELIASYKKFQEDNGK